MNQIKQEKGEKEKNFNNEIHIREMLVDDISAVHYLWRAVGFEFSASDEPEEIERMIKRNPNTCLILEAKDVMVGSVLGGFDGRRGWVHHLSIHPEYQHKGFGRKLMEELTDRFKKMGIKKIKLEILDHNPDLIGFYESIGWKNRTELATMSMTLGK